MRIATLRLSLDQNEIERGIMDPGTISALAAVLVALTDRGDTKVAEAAPA